MAFTYLLNQSYADHGLAMLGWKNAMKANGWTLIDSGDGQSGGDPQIYGAGTDVLTNAISDPMDPDPAYHAHSIVNRKAWFRLRDGAGRREIIVQRSQFNNGTDEWRVKVSALARFTGGTPSGNTAPTATDEVYIVGDETATGRKFWFNTSAQRVDMAIGGAAEGYAFYALSRSTGQRVYEGGIFLDALTETDDDDDDPAVWFVTAVNNVWTQGGVLTRGDNLWSPQGGNQRVWGWQRFINEEGESRMANHCILFPAAVTTDELVTGLNPYDGELDLFGPVYWCSTNKVETGAEDRGAPRGRIKGRSRLFKYIASPSVTDMDSAQALSAISQGSGRYWLTWDGATTPLDLGGSHVARDTNLKTTWVRTHFNPYAGASDSADPVIGNFSPADGQQIKRHATISFDVTDDSGGFAAIFISVEYKESGFNEVAWDGEKFARAYAIESTRTPITNGYRYAFKRAGGWPYTPTFRATAVDLSGNT
jgi:hypothetical protein